MDSFVAVEKEIEKVLTKFGAIKSHSARVLENEIIELSGILKDFETESQESEITPGQVVVLKDAISRAKEKLSRLTQDHRDLHGTVSKVGKAIDRNFTPDFTATIRQDLLQSERNVDLLNKTMVQHFLRHGMEDVANSLVKECGISSEEEIQSEPYAELHRIFEEINNQNLKPGLEWATHYSSELEQKNSSLEFKLHRLAFLQILLTGGPGSQTEAIGYARTHFAKFVNRFEKEIQVLMGTLIYLQSGIQNSPYKYLLSPTLYVEAADVFIKDSCNILGINKDSPLAVIVNAGSLALPALLNLKQVMSRQVQGIWSGRDELPIEIELDPEHRYHSIFACPILRQQSTEENPPMRLKCGHVISRDALNKLSNNSILYKCPYCPLEQSIDNAKLIFF